MKKLLSLICSLALTSTIFAKDVRLKEPPEDLSKYYPPKSENYQFLFNMYKASTSFTGMLTNVQDGDWNNALKWAKALKESYLKIGKMVPKWDKVLKKREINALVKAVKNKDAEGIKANANAVGQSCSKCHSRYQISAKILYHYPSYDMITLEDPVNHSDYEVHDYMKKMTNSLKLLNIYLADGKKIKAKKEGMNFIKRFNGLTQMCSECHTNKLSEQIYFGKSIKKEVKLLSKAIKNLDKKGIQKHLGNIEMMNCMKCHNVHQVPAMLKDKFEKH